MRCLGYSVEACAGEGWDIKAFGDVWGPLMNDHMSFCAEEQAVLDGACSE